MPAARSAGAHRHGSVPASCGSYSGPGEANTLRTSACGATAPPNGGLARCAAIRSSLVRTGTRLRSATEVTEAMWASAIRAANAGTRAAACSTAAATAASNPWV
jgi:hypothetical protein